MITLTNVAKHYNDEVSIGPVDLEIPAGGVTALVGPNGAGKSTLLTMIGRLVGMDEGTIEVAGYDVTSTKSADLAKIVSILRQENHFVTRLTVRQLVGFGRFPYSRAASRQKTRRSSPAPSTSSVSRSWRAATSTSSPAASASARTWQWCSRRTPTTSSSTSR